MEAYREYREYGFGEGRVGSRTKIGLYLSKEDVDNIKWAREQFGTIYDTPEMYGTIGDLLDAIITEAVE